MGSDDQMSENIKKELNLKKIIIQNTFNTYLNTMITHTTM